MTDRPPTPPSPAATPPHDPPNCVTGSEDRVVATTPQLAARIEAALDCRLDETALEDVLIELDRGGYVEWVTVTPTGDYVWDLSESPDRLADAIAEAAVARLHSWLRGPTDVAD